MLKFIIGLIIFVTFVGVSVAGKRALWLPIAFIIAYWAVLKPLFSFSIDGGDWRD